MLTLLSIARQVRVAVISERSHLLQQIWPRNESAWYDNYYSALESAGCQKLPPYSCRHTTATALAITKGIAPQTIRKVMRWSTTKMLDRYVHPDHNDALDAVDQMKKEAAE